MHLEPITAIEVILTIHYTKLLPARENRAIILPANQHMNHHLPTGIPYQLASNWQICVSWHFSNHQQCCLIFKLNRWTIVVMCRNKCGMIFNNIWSENVYFYDLTILLKSLIFDQKGCPLCSKYSVEMALQASNLHQLAIVTTFNTSFSFDKLIPKNTQMSTLHTNLSLYITFTWFVILEQE